MMPPPQRRVATPPPQKCAEQRPANIETSRSHPPIRAAQSSIRRFSDVLAEKENMQRPTVAVITLKSDSLKCMECTDCNSSNHSATKGAPAVSPTCVVDIF
jgi:hypothetical protein